MTETTNEHASLAAALVAAQAEMPAVEEDGVNPHFGSKFTTLDQLIARTRNVLNQHGLAIVQGAVSDADNPALMTKLYHASGEVLTVVTPLYLGKRDMQGLGAAITYARRYAWAALLGIASEEDDDGNRASVTVTRKAGPDEPWPGTWPMGKFEGKSLADTPDGYLRWYIDKGQNELWRSACADELALRQVVT